MNILEQLNIAKNKPEVKITTLGDLKIGEEFEFVYNKPLKVGDMVYVCAPKDFAYGRAIITNNPSECQYFAKRTS